MRIKAPALRGGRKKTAFRKEAGFGKTILLFGSEIYTKTAHCHQDVYPSVLEHFRDEKYSKISSSESGHPHLSFGALSHGLPAECDHSESLLAEVFPKALMTSCKRETISSGMFWGFVGTRKKSTFLWTFGKTGPNGQARGCSSVRRVFARANSMP